MRDSSAVASDGPWQDPRGLLSLVWGRARGGGHRRGAAAIDGRRGHSGGKPGDLPNSSALYADTRTMVRYVRANSDLPLILGARSDRAAADRGRR